MMNEINQRGFSIVPSVINSAELQELLNSLGDVSSAGRRGVLALPVVSQLAHSRRLIALVQSYLSGPPAPVRAIYFDKTPGTNWQVAWHQDLTVAVRTRREVPGFGRWSTKEGVPHVQPPAELLEQMLAIRIHLDDADESNGALRVLPGSHLFGRIPAAQIQECRARQDEVLCPVPACGALIMRPLLLHASARSTSDRHRRVLHIEYAGFTLPGGLEWHEAVEAA